MKNRQHGYLNTHKHVSSGNWETKLPVSNTMAVTPTAHKSPALNSSPNDWATALEPTLCNLEKASGDMNAGVPPSSARDTGEGNEWRKYAGTLSSILGLCDPIESLPVDDISGSLKETAMPRSQRHTFDDRLASKFLGFTSLSKAMFFGTGLEH
jgi:hypothetical protein